METLYLLSKYHLSVYQFQYLASENNYPSGMQFPGCRGLCEPHLAENNKNFFLKKFLNNHNNSKHQRAEQAVCRGLAKSETVPYLSVSTPGLRPQRKPSGRAEPPKVTCAPVSVPPPPTPPPASPYSTRQCSGNGQAEDTCHRGWGPVLTFHVLGSTGGVSCGPQIHCLLRDALCEIGPGLQGSQAPLGPKEKQASTSSFEWTKQQMATGF